MGESAFEVFSTLAANAEAMGYAMPIQAVPVEATTPSGVVFEELRDNMARQGAELPIATRMPLLVTAADMALRNF